jgi:protein gp37
MGETTIQWTDRSVNPILARNKITGAVGHYCRKIAPECANCYASDWQPRFKMPKFQDQVKMIRDDSIEIFFEEKRLLEVLKRRKPTKFFWCDMTDIFGDWVPFDWLDRCFAVMALTPHHTHQILTKRPETMREYINELMAGNRLVCEHARWRFGKGPHGDRVKQCMQAFGMTEEELPTKPLANVWLGVSAGTQKSADEYIPILLQTPAAVRWISAEPLLEPVSYRWAKWHKYYPEGWRERGESQGHLDGLHGIHWVIVGGESGHRARPMHPDWARALRDQCNEAGVPFFFKQWGNWAPLEHHQRRSDWMIVDINGDIDVPDYRWPNKDQGETAMVSVPKKTAGRELDGRTWDEYPA